MKMVLLGSEPFLVKKRLQEIREKYSHLSRVTVLINGPENITSILEQSKSKLFSAPQLLELLFSNLNEEITSKVSSLKDFDDSDSVLLLRFIVIEEIRESSRWFKDLLKWAKVYNPSLSAVDSANMWRKKLESLDIERDALNKFKRNFKGGLSEAMQEIEKLELLGRKITTKDIDDLVLNVSTVTDDLWRSLGKRGSLRVLDDLIEQGVDLTYILQVINSKFRELGHAKGMQDFAIRGMQDCARIDRIIKGVEKGDVLSALKSLLIVLESEPLG